MTLGRDHSDGSPHCDYRHTLSLRPGSAQLEVDRFILGHASDFAPDQLPAPEEVLEVGTSFPAALQEGLLWHLSSQSGVTTDGADQVVEWADMRDPTQTLTSTNGPTRVTLDNGKDALEFATSQQLSGFIGADLQQATVILRVRLTGDANDNDFLYSMGEQGSEGDAMSLSHGGEVGGAPDEALEALSLHWDGTTSHYGLPIYPDRWVTLTQVFYDAPLAGGVYHRLYIEGVDAEIGSSAAPYQIQADDVFLVGGLLGDPTMGLEGEIAEVLVYERALEPWEHAAVASHMWNRMH